MGSYDDSDVLPLKAIDESGNEIFRELIGFKNGCLFAKQYLQFFMVTTISEIPTTIAYFMRQSNELRVVRLF